MVAVQAVVHIDAVAVEMEVKDAGFAVRVERDDVLGIGKAAINVKSGYPSEIKAPTPNNAIKAMNQTFVRADSHAPKIDEYLSWKIAVTPAATMPKASNTTPNTVAHFGNLHWL